MRIIRSSGAALVITLVCLLGVQGASGEGLSPGQAAVGGADLSAAGSPGRPLDLSVASEAVVRQSYILGPGDGLLVSVWGDVNLAWESTVTPEGYIVLSPVGEIPVAGRNLAEADSLISREMRRYYKNVRISTTLSTLRRFEVFVLGEVQKPGRYVAHALTHASTLVQEAGGVTDQGSTRNIRILKGDGSSLTVDIEQFLLLGESEKNPFVTEGDRVVVPVSPGMVWVNGHVGRPDEYEWVEGERIRDYLRLAGGPLDGAILERVELFQFDETTGQTTDSVLCDLRPEIDTAPENDPIIRNGDQIYIRSRPEWHLRRTVKVDGEVFYPGEYAIHEGVERLSDVIRRAGGVTPLASLHEAILVRQTAEETMDREFERLKLMPVADMNEDEYEYFKLKSRERVGRVVVDFEQLLVGDKGEDLLLVRGDMISVPRKKNVINVSGQVGNPGGVEYVSGEKVSYYIDQAGGYGWRARKDKARVIRSRSGEWLYASKVKSLEPGDTIWVPEKPQRDWWQIFKDVMRVAAEVATVYLVIDTATK